MVGNDPPWGGHGGRPRQTYLVTTFNRVMLCSRLNRISHPDCQQRVQFSLFRCIQLINYIRYKNYLTWLQTHRLGDSLIALRLALLSGIRIEVLIDELRQIAGVRVREEKLLG